MSIRVHGTIDVRMIMTRDGLQNDCSLCVMTIGPEHHEIYGFEKWIKSEKRREQLSDRSLTLLIVALGHLLGNTFGHEFGTKMSRIQQRNIRWQLNLGDIGWRKQNSHL